MGTYTDAMSNAGTLSDLDNPVMYLMARGKATTDKIDNLLSLFQETLMNSRLDNKKRGVEMLKEMKIRRETSVITNGHSYGASRLSARNSLLGYMGEMTGGLTYTRNLAALLEQAEKDWPAVQARLEHLRSMIVQKGDVVINLTGSTSVIEAAKPSVDKFINNIPAAGTVSQVNYVVKGARIIQPGEPVKGSYSVASRILSTGFLWDHVRVMGGAYGGFTRFGAGSGVASFLSYRDPNLANTLFIYDRAADVLEEEASKITPEERQRWRNEVLGTTKEDLLEYAAKLRAVKDTGSTVVFGSQAALDAANEVLPKERTLTIESAIPSAEN